MARGEGVKPLALAFAAGGAGAFGFEPSGIWPLTILALAALLFLVERAGSLRSALARGWWFGVGHFTLGLNWIATAFTYQSNMPASLGWVAVVLLSLYLAVYPTMAAGLAGRYGRRSPLQLVLLFAAAWIVTEWLRATMFTGFAWNPLGVALLPTSFSWLSAWVGTYGLSGVAALLAGAFFLALARERAMKAAAAVLVLVLFAASGLAWLLRGEPVSAAATPLRIVQPNIGQ